SFNNREEMTMQRQILMLILLVIWGLCGTLTPVAAEILKFDAAENGTHFVADETPADGDGLPAYGTEYITEGYLYPPGHIERHQRRQCRRLAGVSREGRWPLDLSGLARGPRLQDPDRALGGGDAAVRSRPDAKRANARYRGL